MRLYSILFAGAFAVAFCGCGPGQGTGESVETAADVIDDFQDDLTEVREEIVSPEEGEATPQMAAQELVFTVESFANSVAGMSIESDAQAILAEAKQLQERANSGGATVEDIRSHVEKLWTDAGNLRQKL